MSGGHGVELPKGAKRFRAAAIFFAVLAFFYAYNDSYLHLFPKGFFSTQTVKVGSFPKPTGALFEVKRVVDGDTLLIQYYDKEERVRLIGINTPETVDPRKTVECFGKEAKEEMTRLAQGNKVYLEFDESQGLRDRYDRLLAYVYLESGEMLNRMMIANGFAYEYTYLKPYMYRDDFRAALSFARNQKRGLWSTESGCGE